MSKKVDRAGHWLIKRNPLSEEGVYMYSGKVIDPNGVNGFGLEPDTLYPVYRPKEELAKACESFNGVQFRDEHEMIGDGPGMTPGDASPSGGAIFNVQMNPDDPSEMIGDMRIYGNRVREEIESGKKQLSLGYLCKYKREKGEFKGKPYEFVQYDLEGNHVALVKEGRMGSNVRVFDSITFDQLEVPAMKKVKTKKPAATPAKDEGEGNGGVREEIAKMLEGKDEDVLKAVKDAVEGVLNPKKEDEPAAGDEEEDDEPKKGAEDDPCPHCGTELGLKQKGEGEDEEEPDEGEGGEDEEEDDDPPAKDCGDEGEEEDDEGEKKPAGDSKPAMDMKEVMREIAHRDRIADGVADIIGAFDHSEMTAEEVAVYACDKLELPKTGDCVARIEGYIAARSKSVAATTFAEDSAEDSDFESKYLNPNK